MSYVVTLVGFIPSPRFDGVPWTQARVGEAATSAGPFTTLATITLSPPDADPTHPLTRSFTVSNATLPAGWYLITFLDGAGNQQNTTPVPNPASLIPTPAVVTARNAVRILIRDGMPSTSSAPYGLVRQERLDDEIPAVATPVQTQFYVRFSTVPLGKNVAVFGVPRTVAAYRDGASTPDTVGNGGVTSDLDQNGNFTLLRAPTSQLLVTYGWQFFADADIDQLTDTARSWLNNWSSLTQVPDGMNPALVHYAAGLACQAIARACRLPNVAAGEAREDLSTVAQGFEANATNHFAKAEKARADYWTSADQPKQPASAISSLTYPQYQPYR